MLRLGLTRLTHLLNRCPRQLDHRRLTPVPATLRRKPLLYKCFERLDGHAPRSNSGLTEALGTRDQGLPVGQDARQTIGQYLTVLARDY